MFSENQWLENVLPIEMRSLFKGTNLFVFGGVFVLTRDSPRKDAAFGRQCFTPMELWRVYQVKTVIGLTWSEGGKKSTDLFLEIVYMTMN